ncbi:MAG: hypothetical protein D6812_02850 [Deltaproteobacteria bacterium]|nr:MAG: hypothetical protein D6812_02850 [Deltaproteobacteria bacterium]
MKERLTNWPSTLFGVVALAAGVAVVYAPIPIEHRISLATVLFTGAGVGILWPPKKSARR